MARDKMICGNCGSAVYPKTLVPGSFLIEVILWLFFILPGLLYSIWRLTTKKRVCSKCNSQSLLPPDSPMAQKLVYEQAKAYQQRYKANIEDPVDKWEREQRL
jgi:ribosomal protein S27AE